EPADGPTVDLRPGRYRIECVRVSCRVHGPAQIGPFDRAIRHLSVRSKTIERTTRRVPNRAVREMVRFTRDKSLTCHDLYPFPGQSSYQAVTIPASTASSYATPAAPYSCSHIRGSRRYLARTVA